MKPARLEIMLFTNTLFSLKQFCEKYDTGNQNNSAAYKSLIAACSNGLIPEVLPELYLIVRSHKKFKLKTVVRAEHFLELEYGDEKGEREKHFSINPYSFLQLQLLS